MNRSTNLQRLAAIAKLYGTFSEREIGQLVNTFGKLVSIERNEDETIIKACIEDEVLTVPAHPLPDVKALLSSTVSRRDVLLTTWRSMAKYVAIVLTSGGIIKTNYSLRPHENQSRRQTQAEAAEKSKS